MSYAPMIGNQPSDTENTETRMSASQKYGRACSRVDAGMTWSTQVPRFQPTQAPPTMPRMNEMIVASPTRPRVHGSAAPISSTTGLG